MKSWPKVACPYCDQLQLEVWLVEHMDLCLRKQTRKTK